jgi:hypothetical protein
MVLPLAPLMISTGSKHSIGHGGSWRRDPASATWPTANRAIFIPFRIATPIVVRQLWMFSGSAVSGNFDIGIYGEKGTRLVHGSAVQSGVNAAQVVDVDDTLIGPGVFYFALVLDNTTGTYLGAQMGGSLGKFLGIAEQASAYPLPATATFATETMNIQPLIGLSGRSEAL